MVRFRLTGFLGFPRERPKSTSVGSVLIGEGWDLHRSEELSHSFA